MGSREPDRTDRPLAEQVRERLGVLPNFFRADPSTEAPLAGLWAFAQGAYLDCPLPSLFKERLFVHLSRFSEVRYCVIRHACFLAGVGHAAGDPGAQAQTVAEITALLRRPVPEPSALITVLDRLEASLAADTLPGAPPHPLPNQLPGPGTERESDLFDALTVIFLDARQAVRARAVVAAVAGDPATEQLMGLLAYIRAAHHWTEMHPDLALEPDVAAFLRQHGELARLLTSTADAMAVNPQTAWQAAACRQAPSGCAPCSATSRDGSKSRPESKSSSTLPPA